VSLFGSLGRKAEQVRRSVTGEDGSECPACAATVAPDRETCQDCGTAVERSG
jgi:uncharacterized OB-fold protein